MDSLAQSWGGGATKQAAAATQPALQQRTWEAAAPQLEAEQQIVKAQWGLRDNFDSQSHADKESDKDGSEDFQDAQDETEAA